MRNGRSIEKRLRALEKKFPPRKWDFRAVSMDDLEALERAFNPNAISVENPRKISRRLARLITKLETGTQ
jgi:hypothetical protein